MTKKLSWRLKNLPSISELEVLVANKIITTDEARDILFNEQEAVSKDSKVKALQEQIEFLEGVIDKLTTKHSPWVFTYTPSYPTTVWYSSGNLSGVYGKSITAGSTSLSVDSMNIT